MRRTATSIAVALLCHGCSTSGSMRLDAERTADGETALEVPVSPAAQMAYDHALRAMREDDFVEAELSLEQFILEYPDFPGAYVNLAILYDRDGRIAKARETLERALSLDPGHAVANNQLGILLRKQGEFAHAEQAYLRAIESDPGYALAHRNLGVLLDLYLNRPADALRHYKRYQALLAEPDVAVGRWIIDLERRVGVDDEATRLAQKDGV